jgi:hypothetical protein
VWADPERATFLLVTTDWDGYMPETIMAWGADARRCLGIGDRALDRDDLWGLVVYTPTNLGHP